MPTMLVRKRSGSIVDFDRSRIESAISRAYIETETVIEDIDLSQLVERIIIAINDTYGDDRIPNVEDIQDIVEHAIAQKGDFAVAKAYIIYRQKHAEERYLEQQARLEAVD